MGKRVLNVLCKCWRSRPIFGPRPVQFPCWVFPTYDAFSLLQQDRSKRNAAGRSRFAIRFANRRQGSIDKLIRASSCLYQPPPVPTGAAAKCFSRPPGLKGFDGCWRRWVYPMPKQSWKNCSRVTVHVSTSCPKFSKPCSWAPERSTKAQKRNRHHPTARPPSCILHRGEVWPRWRGRIVKSQGSPPLIAPAEFWRLARPTTIRRMIHASTTLKIFITRLDRRSLHGPIPWLGIMVTVMIGRPSSACLIWFPSKHFSFTHFLQKHFFARTKKMFLSHILFFFKMMIFCVRYVDEYNGTWDGRDESHNFEQQHDVELCTFFPFSTNNTQNVLIT